MCAGEAMNQRIPMTPCPDCGVAEGLSHVEGCPRAKVKELSPAEKLVNQVRALVDKAHAENLNLHLIVLGVTNQGQMVTVSTASLPDGLSRARLLCQAAISELEAVQQALYRAAQAETVRLVQESTKTMVKQ